MRAARPWAIGDARVIVWSTVAVSIVVQLWPALRAILIFDRDAVAHGEIWRIVTGSLVHFSWVHLAGDAAVLIPLCWMLRERRAAEIFALIAGASIAGALFVMQFSPELRWYGGLSAVAHALAVYAALLALGGPGIRRILGAIVLGVLAVKLGIDSTGERHLDAIDHGLPVAVASMSHLGAAICACLLFGIVHLSRHTRVRRLALLAAPSVSSLVTAGCFTYTTHHGAAVAPRLSAHSATVSDSARGENIVSLPTLGVTFAPDEVPGQDGEVAFAFGGMVPKPHPLSAAEKSDITHRIAVALHSTAARDIIEVAPLSGESLASAIASARSEQHVDVLVVLGYDEVQRTYDRGATGLMLSAVGALAWVGPYHATPAHARRLAIGGGIAAASVLGAYLLPTQRTDTRTLGEAVIYDLRRGRILGRVPAQRVSRGLGSVATVNRSLRDTSRSNLAIVCDSLAAAVSLALPGALARATP